MKVKAVRTFVYKDGTLYEEGKEYQVKESLYNDVPIYLEIVKERAVKPPKKEKRNG